MALLIETDAIKTRAGRRRRIRERVQRGRCRNPRRQRNRESRSKIVGPFHNITPARAAGPLKDRFTRTGIRRFGRGHGKKRIRPVRMGACAKFLVIGHAVAVEIGGGAHLCQAAAVAQFPSVGKTVFVGVDSGSVELVGADIAYGKPVAIPVKRPGQAVHIGRRRIRVFPRVDAG